MSNIVKINISTISVCKRGDIKNVISKNDKKNPYNNVNTKINELLDKSSQNNYDDIKNGILLAIKTVQENLNHEGTKYFFQENYYGELGQNGIDAFNTLTSGDNLRDLEKICYHRKSYNIFNSDIKYSFYKTNYTDTAIKLRNELDGIIALYKKRIIINQSIESKGSAVFNPKNLSNSINEIKNISQNERSSLRRNLFAKLEIENERLSAINKEENSVDTNENDFISTKESLNNFIENENNDDFLNDFTESEVLKEKLSDDDYIIKLEKLCGIEVVRLKNDDLL